MKFYYGSKETREEWTEDVRVNRFYRALWPTFPSSIGALVGIKP